MLAGQVYMLGSVGGVQHAQHAPYPADVRHAQSGGISDLEITTERPVAEGAYHSGRDGLRPSGRQVMLDAGSPARDVARPRRLHYDRVRRGPTGFERPRSASTAAAR